MHWYDYRLRDSLDVPVGPTLIRRMKSRFVKSIIGCGLIDAMMS
jgi:hypothetical protein